MPSLHIPPLQGGKPVGRASTPPTGNANSASHAPTRSHDRGAGISVEAHAGYEIGNPPIDSARVSQIRAAIESGSYAVAPGRIADAMIAARLFPDIGE